MNILQNSDSYKNKTSFKRWSSRKLHQKGGLEDSEEPSRGHFDYVFFLSFPPISTRLLLTMASKETPLQEHVPRNLSTTKDPMLLLEVVPTEWGWIETPNAENSQGGCTGKFGIDSCVH